MSKKTAFSGLFLLAVCAAFVFRVVRLDIRPMHHDEANQAVKFGGLLERGEYTYDPVEHHGPTLYYSSLPFAWVSTGNSFAALDERTLRFVPALFGVGIILLLLLFKDGFSRSAIVVSGIFVAVSPLMVFYSRFYIQETLLVFFLLGVIAASWRYHVSRSWGWAAATGVFIGLMYATKETCNISFGALFMGLLLARIFTREPINGKPPIGHALVFFGSAFVVAFLLFSSFFQNPRGIVDSILSFQNYLGKAGEAGFHSYPWPYYLKMLTFSRYGTGPIWSEVFIPVLAIVGCVAAFHPRRPKGSSSLFMRFIFFFALLATAVYSLIPYKTPWNMLPFFIGIILLAGNGAAFLLDRSKNLAAWILILLVLCTGIFHLGYQSHSANFKFQADSRNPYVYAHTSSDFLNLVRRVEDVSRFHPDQKDMLIKVITHPDEAWPLPWYLRGFTRVGYWQEAAMAGVVEDVPVVISSIDITEEMQTKLMETHQGEFFGLRPEVLLAVHIRKDLWEIFLENRR
ncbi:MAG: TIGR03663 family protein [Candidatus Aminicenantes bacterium]|nr:MAG: TIGR03663 family protein [Candidatus Aminicenantes bacterium]